MLLVGTSATGRLINNEPLGTQTSQTNTDGSQRGLPLIPLRTCEGSVTAHNVVQANLLVAAAFLMWYSLDPNLRRVSGWDEKGRRALETARTTKEHNNVHSSLLHAHLPSCPSHMTIPWHSFRCAIYASLLAQWHELERYPDTASRVCRSDKMDSHKAEFLSDSIPRSCSMWNWENSWKLK